MGGKRFSSTSWTIAFVATISIARVGMGVYNALFGPTLLYLSDNVDVSVTKFSAVFSGRSLGILLGAILGGVIKNITGPNFRHLFTLGLGIGILGLVELAVPWIEEFWVLIVNITLGGIMYGYLDAGLQALILQLWGEEASRSLIQVFHLTFSIGAFIGPLVASPFLEKSDEEVAADESCPDTNTGPVATPTPLFNQSTTTDSYRSISFDPTGWAYIIAASWMVFVAVILALLASLNVEARVSKAVQKRGYSSEERPEEPLRDVIWVFLPFIASYYCGVTADVFYTYIYSVTLCTDLDFTVTQASQITSVFWLGLGVGRLFGVAVASYLKPKTIYIGSIVGSIVDSLLMCIFGEQNAWLAWTASALHGFATGLLFPSGVSWISQVTNISGTYMFICNIGNAVGSLTMLPFAGYLFDLDPFNVMYLVFALASLNALFFGLAYMAGLAHKKFLLQKEIQERKVLEGNRTCDNTTREKKKSIETLEDCITSTKL